MATHYRYDTKATTDSTGRTLHFSEVLPFGNSNPLTTSEIVSSDVAQGLLVLQNSDGTRTNVWVNGLVMTNGLPTGGTVYSLFRFDVSTGFGIEWLSSIAFPASEMVTGLTASILGTGSSTFIGGNENDRLYGGAGNDAMNGGKGDDALRGYDGNDTIFGGDGNDILVGGSGYNWIYGGNGNDTISYQDFVTGINFTLGANGSGSFVFAGGKDTYYQIERVRGTQLADTITGNSGDNRLEGMNGADSLVGGSGFDYAQYNHEHYFAGSVNGINANIAAGTVIDTFGNTDTISGIEGIFGTHLNDTMVGDIYNNDLIGMGGNDSLSGGDGNDYLEIGNGQSTVNGGIGSDTLSFVNSTITQGANLFLSATGSGSFMGSFGTVNYVSIENLRGTGYDDLILGNAANNRLEGMAGSDTLIGDAGIDTVRYARDENFGGMQGVVVNLSQNTGFDGFGNIDELYGIENVEGTNFNDFISGDFANNHFLGGNGNDTLNGLGGSDTLYGGAGNDIFDRYYNYNDDDTSADRFYGGTGDDIYHVNSTLDLVTELANEGNFDRVILTSVVGGVNTITNYTIGVNVEGVDNNSDSATNVITGNAANNWINDYSQNASTLSGGAGADSIYGGNGADSLMGDEGNDTLVGGHDLAHDILNGGLGADSMVGGLGNDIYYVDDVADIVVELQNAGTDVVNSSISYSVSANVERINLTGTANINATGSLSNDILAGNWGNNILTASEGSDSLYGNLGLDTLTGGLGADRFYFNTTLSASNLDTITDFTTAQDNIMLKKSLFAGLTTNGSLDSANFVNGTAAIDANDFIVYNQATGSLSYDSNGNAAGGMVQFAQLGAGTNLVASDIILY